MFPQKERNKMEGLFPKTIKYNSNIYFLKNIRNNGVRNFIATYDSKEKNETWEWTLNHLHSEILEGNIFIGADNFADAPKK